MNKGTGKPLSLYQVLCAFSDMGRKIKVPPDSINELKDWTETNHLDHLHTHKDGELFQYNISNYTEMPKGCLKDKVNAIDFALVRIVIGLLAVISSGIYAIVSPGVSIFVWWLCMIAVACCLLFE